MAMALAPLCVCADGGLSAARAASIIPDAVIGDFDSVHSDDLQYIPTAAQHPIDEQDTTDFHKSLARISAPLVLGVGFCGGRLDHQLAALHTLIKAPGPPCLLIAQHEVLFHCPSQVDLPLQAGDTISLFPLRAVCGASRGLKWPIDGLTLEPGKQIATSNQATGHVHLTLDGSGLIAIVPRARMQAIIPVLARM